MNPKTNPPGGEPRKVIEVIRPYDLKAKAPLIRADLKDALRKAEAAIATLTGDYDGWIRREDGRLRMAFREAETAPDAADNMARIAHDMKGLGGTFGYPLMSIVCDGLYRFLEGRRSTLTPKELDVARVHLDAVALILKYDIRDDTQIGWAEIINDLAKVGAIRTLKKKSVIEAAKMFGCVWLHVGSDESEVLEVFATKRRDRKAALKFLKRAMKRYGQPTSFVTDRLRSYRAAMNVIGNMATQTCGRWLNNRAENSHQPFRRREGAMARFRDIKTLQKFAAVHASIHNHFNH